MKAVPHGQDGDFSFEGLAEAYNSELANDLGNLVNRTISMVDKYFKGQVPSPTGVSEPLDDELREVAQSAVRNAHKKMEELDLTSALRYYGPGLRSNNTLRCCPLGAGREERKSDFYAC